MSKLSILILSIILSTSAISGINGLTHHSRANCVNNETISWDLRGSHELYLQTNHFKDGDNDEPGLCVEATNWQKSWRVALVHWGEGTGGWQVFGYHFMKDEFGNMYEVAQEQTIDCSIYDGWWEQDKPNGEFI